MVLDAPGTYQDTLSAQGGCDSIIILELFQDPSYLIQFDTALCDGDTLVIGTFAFNETGLYTVPFTTVNGCDSIFIINLTIHPLQETLINETICQGQSYVLGDSAYTETGTYEAIFEDVNGCDSTVTLELEVLPTQTDSLSADLCEGETFTLAGIDFDQPGNYELVFPGTNGCDSILFLELIEAPSYVFSEAYSICEGDSIVVGGTTLSDPGIYTIELSTYQGCDSILIVDLTLGNAVAIAQEVTICFGEFYTVGNSTYFESGTYVDTLPGNMGCDSIITTILEAQMVAIEVENTFSCMGDTVIFEGQMIFADTLVADTAYYTTGCDSVYLFTSFFFLPINESMDSVTICAGESYEVNGNVYTEAGTYVDTIPAVPGCFEIFTLVLDVYEPSNFTIAAGLCEGGFFTYDTITIDNPGIYTYLIDTTGLGCPDTLTLDIFPIPPIELLSFEIFPDDGSGNGAVYPVFGGGTPPYIYVWDSGQMTNNLENVPAGSYLLTVIDSDNCFNTFGFEIPLETSTHYQAFDASVELYPNPVWNGEYIQVDASGISQQIWNVSLWNANGSFLRQQELDLRSGKGALKAPTVSGVYLLRFSNSTGSWLERIIVE